MAFYTTVATIRTADNVEANYATNTWHFEADDLTALGAAHSALSTFYTTIDTFFSPLVKTTDGLEIQSYDDVDPIPRPPKLTNLYSLSVGTGDPLPTEVALVMSFQGDRQAGVPQARRRGRVYIPFLGEGNNDSAGRPASALYVALAAAGDALLSASVAASTWQWLTFSRVAPGYTTVTNGWVDNEWDTQRRRGRPATVRSVFN